MQLQKFNSLHSLYDYFTDEQVCREYLELFRWPDEEEEKLKAILRDMIGDFEIVAGITFNKALSTIVNK